MKFTSGVLGLALVFAVGCGGSNDENNEEEPPADGACPIDTSFDGAVVYEGSTFPPFQFEHPAGWETLLGGEVNSSNQFVLTLAPPDRGAQPEVQIDVIFSAELKDSSSELGEPVHTFNYDGEEITAYGVVRPPSALGNFSLPYEGQFLTGNVRVVRTLAECDSVIGPTMKAVLDSFTPNSATTFMPAAAD